MIRWCFAHDNLTYARYLSAYVSEMSHLEEEHPEAFKYLKSGGLPVQIAEGNPFGKVPVDQACEETVNKDTQTAGGTKGLSLEAGAASKYYLVAEYRRRFADVIPQPSAYMIDAMALVQRLKGDHKTFAEVTESLLSLVLHEGSNSNRIDV